MTKSESRVITAMEIWEIALDAVGQAPPGEELVRLRAVEADAWAAVEAEIGAEELRDAYWRAARRGRKETLRLRAAH